MKFCPYCGVSLPGNAVSFCPECGETLPIKKASDARQQKGHPSRPRNQTPQSKSRPLNPMDISYDGYYDDVQPVDAGVRGEGTDPELIRQIVLVVLGALGIITFAIVLMMLL